MRKRCLTLIIMAFTISLFCAAPNARGDEFKTIDDASPQELVDGMAGKLLRGVANIATGWMELPKQIYLASKEDGLGKGLTVGPVKGLEMTLLRTASGVGESATFFVSYPGFFKPYFDPAYVWEK